MSPHAQIYLHIPGPSLLDTRITRSTSKSPPSLGSWCTWLHVTLSPLITGPSCGPLDGTRGTCPEACVGTLIMTKTWFCRGKYKDPSSFFKLRNIFSCEDAEFTCPDGTCLPVSQVCDGQPQCEDEADERGCDLVQFPISSQYIPSLPPVPENNSPAPVNISVDIINIANVKETSLQWTVKLELQMDWHDPRLDWRNLRGEQNLNIIPLQVRIFINEAQLRSPFHTKNDSRPNHKIYRQRVG